MFFFIPSFPQITICYTRFFTVPVIPLITFHPTIGRNIKVIRLMDKIPWKFGELLWQKQYNTVYLYKLLQDFYDTFPHTWVEIFKLILFSLQVSTNLVTDLSNLSLYRLGTVTSHQLGSKFKTVGLYLSSLFPLLFSFSIPWLLSWSRHKHNRLTDGNHWQ